MKYERQPVPDWSDMLAHMSDIVEGLRKAVKAVLWTTEPPECAPAVDPDDADEAADTITALRAEVEGLGRDYNTVRDAHDDRVRENARLTAEVERLRAALVAFADHFGPFEDNDMLHEDARKCFALARAALTKGERDE